MSSTCTERTTMQIRGRDRQKAAKKLLFLSDHDDVITSINALENEGYIVQQQYCSQLEADSLHDADMDTILIDLNAPSMESVSICQSIREVYDGPVLFLSAPTDGFIQLLGLEMGADDFLFKPQPVTLLLTKIRTLLRRSEKMNPEAKTSIRLGNC